LGLRTGVALGRRPKSDRPLRVDILDQNPELSALTGGALEGRVVQGGVCVASPSDGLQDEAHLALAGNTGDPDDMVGVRVDPASRQEAVQVFTRTVQCTNSSLGRSGMCGILSVRLR
jgi:hypothetical protein